MRTTALLLTSAAALFSFTGCAADTEVIATTSSELTNVNDTGTLARDEWRRYGPFNVHELSRLHAELDIRAGGDADLYVRQGAPPTESEWDCRPYSSGSTPEDCDIRGPGVFYAAVAGYALSSDFQLRMFYVDADTQLDCGNGQIDPGEVCEIGNYSCAELDPTQWSGGEASCDLNCGGYNTSACIPADAPELTEFEASGAVARGWLRHLGPFSVSDGAFLVAMTGSGDADLYVKRGSEASAQDFDCRSRGPESIESCELDGPGLYYIAVLGYSTTSNYTVSATYLADPENAPTVMDQAGSVAAGQWLEYGPFDAGPSGLRAILTGLDDADLYVRRGAPPSLDESDCRPYTSGTNETCALEGSGQYWVGISGYAPSSYFELKVVY